PLDRAARHRDVLASQLAPHLARAVDAEIVLVHTSDLRTKLLVTAHTLRSPLRSGLPGLDLVVRRRGDRQLLADRLDPVSVAVLVDKVHHHFGRRSSSAWAKNADALRRISLARFNSRFSRSS